MRRSLKRQYILRLVSVILLVTSASIFVGAALLVPAFLRSGRLLSNALAQEVTASDNVDKKQYKLLRDKVSAINSVLTRISAIEDAGAGSAIDELVSVQAKHASTISIRSIRYSAREQSSLRISGIASDRASLSGFVSELESSEMFEDVDLPIGNLVDREEIPFALVIIIHHE